VLQRAAHSQSSTPGGCHACCSTRVRRRAAALQPGHTILAAAWHPVYTILAGAYRNAGEGTGCVVAEDGLDQVLAPKCDGSGVLKHNLLPLDVVSIAGLWLAAVVAHGNERNAQSCNVGV
jgi:hypothetical protein